MIDTAVARAISVSLDAGTESSFVFPGAPNTPATESAP
jgi:hypothetical protein